MTHVALISEKLEDMSQFLINTHTQFKKHVLSSSSSVHHHTTSEFPILSLPLSGSEKLFPLILLYRKNLYFVAIPLSSSSSSATYCLLHNLSTLTSSTKKHEEIHWLLASMLPFGSPVQTETRAIKSMHYISPSSADTHISTPIKSSSTTTTTTHNQQKRPSWKPLLNHTSSSSALLSLSIREELRVVQYSDMEDYVDVSGTFSLSLSLALSLLCY